MQTHLADPFKDHPAGREAERILRACVHCGFCTATCPTYQLLGDELDGPRGRIYLIKQMLEGEPVSRKTQSHLDRCLTCRACESTCPSGVEYGHLVDIGRGLMEERVPRPWRERLARRVLRAVLPHPRRFTPLLRLGQSVRGLLPARLRESVPPYQAPSPWPAPRHARKMLVLDGCVQPAITPNINAAAARVLDRVGISLIRAENAGCCGALSYHLSAHGEGLDFARRNIDAWWPHVQAGVEAIVTTASGCGALLQDYGYLLREDPRYADKARRISALALDIGVILSREELPAPPAAKIRPRIAFHAACSLQHAQKRPGLVEHLLQRCGFELTPVPDPHLCCGSAGAYALLERGISQRLLEDKLAALASGQPDGIATTNIGCLTHLQSRATVPVRHWIEILDELLADQSG